MNNIDKTKIIILDVGLSNVGSVKNIIETLDLDVTCEIVTDPNYINESNLLIIPGVGHFKTAAAKIKNIGLHNIIEQNLKRRDFRLLGICLGMQLLGTTSTEGEGAGLGLIDGESTSLQKLSRNLKVPNMGWCDVTGFGNSIDNARFYHVHSFHFQPKSSSDIWLTTSLMGNNVVVGIKRDRVCGVQFHPEKSHRFGKLFFQRYLENAL